MHTDSVYLRFNATDNKFHVSANLLCAGILPRERIKVVRNKLSICNDLFKSYSIIIVIIYNPNPSLRLFLLF